MDGQNFPNDFQNNQAAENTQTDSMQNNYYQDNTSAPYGQTYAYNQPEQKQSNPLAIVGLVMGILSIVLACCDGIGIVPGIAGIICSALSKKKGKSGVGTAGLICSIIGTVFSAIMIVYVVLVVAAVLADPELLNTIQSIQSY